MNTEHARPEQGDASMTATEQQWEAYYAARALAVRISAAHNRALAAAARLHPVASIRADAAEYELLAAECDALAARKEAANRTPDFTWRFVRGHRLQLALIARFRRQDAGERVCK